MVASVPQLASGAVALGRVEVSSSQIWREMGALGGIGVKLVICVGLGYLLRRTDFVSERFSTELGRLLIWVLAPFAILSAATEPFTTELGTAGLVAGAITLGYYAVAIPVTLLIVRALKLPNDEQRSFVCLVVFTNSLFIGMPIVGEVVGAQALVPATIVNLVFYAFFFTFGDAHMDPGRRFRVQTLLKSPPLIACVIAIIVFFARIPVPTVLASAFDMVGSAMAPVAMFIVGFGLAEANFKEIFTHPISYLINGLRLLVWPVLLLAIIRIFDLDALGGEVAVLLLGMPSATAIVVLAAQNRTAFTFTAQTLVQSNVLMFVTLPFLYWLMQVWT